MLITTLLPLLARYSLGFDLVAGPDDTVTLTVIPRRHEGAADKLESGETRPISLTASAADIDAELAKGEDGALGQLIAARKALADQLAEQRQAADAARTAAAEAAKAKAATPTPKPATAGAKVDAPASPPVDATAEDEGSQEVVPLATAVHAALLRAAAAQPEGEALQLATASYAAALDDFGKKKKSRLTGSGLAAAARGAPAAALCALPALLDLATAARSAAVQVAALALLAATFTPAQAGAQLSAPAAALLVPVLTPLGSRIGTALCSGVSGVGMRKDRHAEAVKSCVAVVEGWKKVSDGKRLVDLISPDGVNGLAKAVVTVRSLAVLPKVEKQLARLVAVTGIQALVDAAAADPALAARITKARPAAAAAPKPVKKKQGGPPTPASTPSKPTPASAATATAEGKVKHSKKDKAAYKLAKAAEKGGPEAAAAAAAPSPHQQQKEAKKEAKKLQQDEAAQNGTKTKHRQQGSKKRKVTEDGDEGEGPAFGTSKASQKKSGTEKSAGAVEAAAAAARKAASGAKKLADKSAVAAGEGKVKVDKTPAGTPAKAGKAQQSTQKKQKKTAAASP
ncbi:MAG: hypothetical protein WDW38_004983 [Sanguina aurantia]